MTIIAACLLLSGLTMAGPVGRYLGFEVGRQGTGMHRGRDSVHFLLPPSDTVFERNYDDTTTALAETLIGGDPAWLIRHVVFGDTNYTSVDTAFESGDSLLRRRYPVGESLRWYNQYLVPFAVGSWWRLGIAGTYHLDLDGDGTIDTVDIWGDTCRVTGIEDVTVPYGTVTGCYKMRSVTRQALAMVYQGIPARETSYSRSFEWYKDSLSWVKDSVLVEGSAFTQIGIWLRALNFVMTSLGQLTSLDAGVAEGCRQPTAHSLQVTATPNPFRTATSIRLTANSPELRIHDASGRLVRTLADRSPLTASRLLVWDGRDGTGRALPAGTYIIRASGPGTSASVVVVKSN